MAANTHMSIASWDLGLNAALAALNGGYAAVYSGTQPATPDAALSGNVLLATRSRPSRWRPALSSDGVVGSRVEAAHPGP